MVTDIKITEATGNFHFAPLDILMFYKNHCSNREWTIFVYIPGNPEGQTDKTYQPTHLLSEPQVTCSKVAKGIGLN